MHVYGHKCNRAYRYSKLRKRKLQLQTKMSRPEMKRRVWEEKDDRVVK
jgi:hypothetical protein